MSTDSRPKKHRSPAYPFIGLETAIGRARTLYEKEKTHAADLPVVAGHWGFKAKSSGGLQTVSALKQFGLMDEDSSSGAKRRVRLSDRARKIILHAKNTTEWSDAVKLAALNPPLYAELYQKWGKDLPSDDNIRTYLTFDRNFNEASVSGVIKDYKDTLAFAGLDEQYAGDVEPKNDPPAPTKTPPPNETGFPETLMIQHKGNLSLAIPFSAGTIHVDIHVEGEAVKPAHLKRVRRYLDLIEEQWDDPATE